MPIQDSPHPLTESLSVLDSNYKRAQRVAIIPILFVALILITLGYIAYSYHLFQEESAVLETLNRQKVLQGRYISQLLLTSHHFQTANREVLLKRTQKNIHVLLHGGVINTPDGATLNIPPAPNQAVVSELQRRRHLLDELESISETLESIPTNSPEQRQILTRIALLITSLEDNANYLPGLYLRSGQEKIDRLLEYTVLLVILTGGVGIYFILRQRKLLPRLLESEKLFRQIFNESPIGKVLVSPEGRWMRVNTAICQLLGYTTEELANKTFQEVTHPEDVLVEAPLRAKLRSGELETYQLTKRYIHKNGQPIWVSVSVGSLHQNGQPLLFIVQVQDITQQKQAMDALAASEAKYRSIFESATDGIIITSLDGQIQSANRMAHQLFGYDDQALIGKSALCLIPPRFQDTYQSRIQHFQETGILQWEGKTATLMGINPEGAEFPLELSLSFWGNPQQERFCTAIIRDMTARQRAKEEHNALLRTNRSLGEFAAIAAHDLQEPLRKISFYTERLNSGQDQAFTETCRENTDKILKATERMQQLIHDLIIYSDISQHSMRLEEISLNELAEKAVAQLETEIKATGARIQIDELPVIKADSTLLFQLFTHIIQNGLKFCQVGVSPMINIYGKVQIKETMLGQVDFAEIHVQDQGIGFHEKYLDRIFKVFQRLHHHGEYAGTGIGLAICQRIAELHHGSITATSTPGSGSIFIITLPVQQVSLEEVGTRP